MNCEHIKASDWNSKDSIMNVKGIANVDCGTTKVDITEVVIEGMPREKERDLKADEKRERASYFQHTTIKTRGGQNEKRSVKIEHNFDVQNVTIITKLIVKN